MESRSRRAWYARAALPALALLGLVSASGLMAQQQEAAQIGPDRLELFARVHLSLVEARVDYHDAIGRNHDPARKLELRDAMLEHLAAIYEEHQMSPDEYENITFVISVDDAQRTSFEETIARLEEAGS